MKKDYLKLVLSPTLNRSMVYTSYPLNKPLYFSIMFNKKSSGLEAQYDTRNYMITSNQIIVRMFRNLSNCMFSNVFFYVLSKVDKTGNKKIDYRTKFLGINTSYKDAVLQFLSERLDLRSETENRKKDYSNYLMVSGWKLFDLDSEIIFYFVQRKLFNIVTRTSVIRTMGLQFSTNHGCEVLDQYHEDFVRRVKKKDEDVVPEYLLDDEDDMESQLFNK